MIAKKPSYLEDAIPRAEGQQPAEFIRRERGPVSMLEQAANATVPTATLLSRIARLEAELDSMARKRADENQQLAEFVQDILRRLNNVESQIGG